METQTTRKRHEIKATTAEFLALASGRPFTVRKNDRNYDVRDELEVREFFGGEFTGRWMIFMVSWVLTAAELPGELLPPGVVVLGVKILPFMGGVR